jgi:valine--pyruvate aminotransferase
MKPKRRIFLVEGSFTLSRAGQLLASETGIFDLMEDLGRASAAPASFFLLGGASPARIPQIEELWLRRMEELLRGPESLSRCLAFYDPPGGQASFAQTLAKSLQRHLGWPVEPENVVVTLGSQFALFLLFLLFGGWDPEGRFRPILLPRIPEYLGLAHQGLGQPLFAACLPSVELLEPPFFRYEMDLKAMEKLSVKPGAIFFSSPCNPTGQTPSEAEWKALRELANRWQVPLIVDGAYGPPFPDVVFDSYRWTWDPGFIYTFTLSKLGLPGIRTAIVLAEEEVAEALRRAQSVVALAPAGLGQELLCPLLESGELFEATRRYIRPFYRSQYEQTLAFLEKEFGTRFPYRVHWYQGGFFFWLWFPELPISSLELYQRLKQRGVLVVPGRHFAYGLSSPWEHADQALRLSFTQPPNVLQQGIVRIAEELDKVHRGKASKKSF